LFIFAFVDFYVPLYFSHTAISFYPPFFEQPLIKDLLRIGTQFVGYREYASKAEGNALLLLLLFFCSFVVESFNYIYLPW
jgi:hypothetical protein